MKASLQIALFIAQILLCTICFAQSEKIDSLERELKSLKDSARIDCLINLGYIYLEVGNKDSAEYLTELSYKEAATINYSHGIAESYALKAILAQEFSNDFPKVEQFAQESLRWYNRTQNKKNIENAYFQLGFSHFAQSSFDTALRYLKQSYSWCIYNKNTTGLIPYISSITAAIYKETADYDNFFKYIKQGFELASETHNKTLLSGTLLQLAEIYMKLEDYSSALIYFKQAFQMDDPEIIRSRGVWDIWVKFEFAETFSHLNQFDSAWYYYDLFKPGKDKESHNRVYLLSSGECHFLQKNYKPALQNFMQGLEYNRKLNDRNQIMRALLDIAKTHDALQNDTLALKYARELLSIATMTKARQYIRDGNQVLYSVFDRLKQKDSSSLYFRHYITMKDSISIDQTKGKLIAYNYEQKIDLLDKEKEIQQTKFKKESFLKKMLIAGILGLLLLGFFLLRTISLKRKNEAHQRKIAENELLLQKFENEKTKAELEQQASELEMQALRAQMNPHFIFNSLNSINRFILQNNKAQASEYLTKFSRLVRLILQNSQSALISLESELESLQLYLELEAVRFDHHFEFKIKVDDELDTDIIKVPPLIIQPYAENAIWHGLMNKEDKGHLEIELFQEHDMLCCKITDDGIGRQRAAEIKGRAGSTYKSMGMQITASRIEMLQQKKQMDEHIKITDLVLPDGSAAGTEVIIKIPVMYN